MITFLDFETTGIPLWSEPDTHPQQPRVVSLAALTCTEDFEHDVHFMYHIIKPDGWVIPDEAASKHGITQAFAERYGVPIRPVLAELDHVVYQSEFVVSYNADFEKRLHEIELIKNDRHNYLDPRKWRCMMRAMTGILKIPGEYGDYRWPKLELAYERMIGKPLVGSHNSSVDVRATKELAWFCYVNGHGDFRQWV